MRRRPNSQLVVEYDRNSYEETQAPETQKQTSSIPSLFIKDFVWSIRSAFTKCPSSAVICILTACSGGIPQDHRVTPLLDGACSFSDRHRVYTRYNMSRCLRWLRFSPLISWWGWSRSEHENFASQDSMRESVWSLFAHCDNFSASDVIASVYVMPIFFTPWFSFDFRCAIFTGVLSKISNYRSGKNMSYIALQMHKWLHGFFLYQYRRHLYQALRPPPCFVKIPERLGRI